MSGLLALVVVSSGTTRASVDEPVLEQVIVTGTRIHQPEARSASPIAVVPESLFEESGSLSVERTLAMMPQFVPTAGAATNEPSNDGQENLSLRGLGASRTLVLVDGKRLMPADGRGVVDVNVIPPALVRSVDVMTGGASTAYGSDAIAGVVNFRLLERYQGVQLSGQWIETAKGGGSAYDLGVLAGTDFGDSRGHFVAYAGYSERQQLNQGDRKFSRYPYVYVPGIHDGYGPKGSFVAGGAGVPDGGFSVIFSNKDVFDRVFAGYGYPPGTVSNYPGIGVNDDRTVFTIGDGQTPGSIANYRGERDPVLYNDVRVTYNTAPGTALLMPLDRATLFARASYEFSPAVELYGQAIYANYQVTRQLPPDLVGILLAPPTNPFVPPDLKLLADSRDDPAAPFRLFATPTVLGPRRAENDREVLQLDMGLRGELSGRWRYDAYAQAGRNDRTEKQTALSSLSRMEELLFAPDGGVSACGGLDVFGRGRITRACADYFTLDAANKARLDEIIAEAAANGPVATWTAGDVRAALGVFYRHDHFRYTPEPALEKFLPAVPGVIGPRPDVSGLGVGAAREGTESNTDLYAELLVPLLQGPDAATPRLDVDLGYRYSWYRQAGGVEAYKGELRARPTRKVLLRGTYQHAVRAPSVEELYYPQLSGQFSIDWPDPCSTSSEQRRGPDRAQVERLCLEQGVPPDILPTYDYVLRNVNGVSGGNPDLRPEQARTYTVGVVLTSPFERTVLDNMSVSLDWYHIAYEDGIGRWTTYSALDRCYDPTYNPDYVASNPYCTFFKRDAVSGDVLAVEIDRNIGRVETSGMDVGASWSATAGAGRASANLNLTYVDTWKVTEPGGYQAEYAGTIGSTGLGGAIPRWRSLLQLGYDWQQVRLYARWQYVSSMRDAVYPDFHVPATNYVGAGVRVEVAKGPLAGLGVTIGVDNLFDEEPPLFPSYSQANTDPSQYDVLGRRFFISVQYSL